jgi:DNA repair protein RecN (Recombination protein N)
VLGERADTDCIRSGSDSALVEALLELPDAGASVAVLEETGLKADDGILVLRREIATSGRSRSYVGGSPVTLSVLKRLGDELVDLHGQHAHQLLLDPGRHLDFLDAFARLGERTQKVNLLFRERERLRNDGRELERRAAELQERRDLHEYQEREIRTARIVPGEEAELRERKNRWEKAEKLAAIVASVMVRLSEGEDAVRASLSKAVRDLDELARLDPGIAAHREALDQALIQIEDVARSLGSYAERLQFDPAQLDEARDRLDLLRRLQQKYGGTLEKVLEQAEVARRALRSLESVDEERTRQQTVLAETEQAIRQAAGELSRERERAAAHLQKRVARELADLGMEKAAFQVAFAPSEEIGPRGAEGVEFMLSANKGEPLRPLARVASGGELSRIMLALKTVLAEIDHVGTLVFDEIDTGIGGRTAEVVGAKLAAVARSRQVLCITHLPQIARFARRHLLVRKQSRENRTVTTLIPLDLEERVQELARMLAGRKVTPLTVAHAREMLEGKREGAP